MKIKVPFLILVIVSTLLISCGTGKSESENKADSLNLNEGSNEKSMTYTLKWKGVEWTESGPSYAFEDQNGKGFLFNGLAVPNFQLDNNPYFTIRYDAAEPEYKIKDGIKDKWFQVIVEKRPGNNGDQREVDLIIGIEPVQ